MLSYKTIFSLMALALLAVAFDVVEIVHAEETHIVKMKSLSYEPKQIQIKVGDSIEWINEAYTEHSATSVDDTDPKLKFDTGLIQPKKKSKKIKFAAPGTYKYHCTVHGPMMNATVVVAP